MSEKHKKKKRLDSPEPTAVIRELMAQPGIKKVRIFKNGEEKQQGIQMVINDRQVHDLDIFLAAVTNRIDLPFGARKLYTATGTQIKDIRQIQDGKDYVASSGIFTPQTYGGSATRSRAKSVEPERKKKKKKKRATPAKHAEKHKENEAKEVEIPLNHPKKKVKKTKKKKENKEAHHEEKKEKDEIEVNRGEVRSVSRYAAHRPPTRAESRMHWKDTSIDEDEKSDNENGHDSHAHNELYSGSDSEREGILPSEIHIPFNNESSHGIENLHIDKEKHNADEALHETKDNAEKETKKEVDKRKKSAYHWGDLSSFTNNIQSLLSRKE